MEPYLQAKSSFESDGYSSEANQSYWQLDRPPHDKDIYGLYQFK